MKLFGYSITTRIFCWDSSKYYFKTISALLYPLEASRYQFFVSLRLCHRQIQVLFAETTKTSKAIGYRSVGYFFRRIIDEVGDFQHMSALDQQPRRLTVIVTGGLLSCKTEGYHVMSSIRDGDYAEESKSDLVARYQVAIFSPPEEINGNAM